MRALNHPKTKEIISNVPEKLLMNLSPLDQIFDESNRYERMKKSINSESFPMLPFIPLVKYEVESAALYNLDEEEESKYGEFIHFRRLDLMVESYEKLHKCQQFPYNFESLTVYQKFFERFY